MVSGSLALSLPKAWVQPLVRELIRSRKPLRLPLDILASHNFRWDPLMLCLWEEKTRRRVQRKVNVAEIWFPSDGHSLKEICPPVLNGAYMVGDSCLPSTCPWHCAFPLVTVKSRSHWTQRPESRTISPFSSLLHTANNVAFTSLWKILGFVPQGIVKHL